MLNKIKEILNLNPKSEGPSIPNNNDIQIKCGIQNNKVVLMFNNKIDKVSFDKDQLAALLAALATNAGQLK